MKFNFSVAVFLLAFICLTKSASAEDILSVKVTMVQFSYSNGYGMQPFNCTVVVHALVKPSNFKGFPVNPQKDTKNLISATYSPLETYYPYSYMQTYNGSTFTLSGDKYNDKSFLVIELWNYITPEQKYYKAGVVGTVAYFKSLPNIFDQDLADKDGNTLARVSLEFQSNDNNPSVQ